MSVTGIDVHGSKGFVDWKKVRASGREFAYLKVSEGLTFRDARYHDNYAGAHSAGLLVGGYHFARPDLHPGGAAAEARAFHKAMDGRYGDLPPALDLETHAHGVSLVKWASDFLLELRRLGHARVTLYTYRNFWEVDMGNPNTTFGDALLWWAEYGPVKHTPKGYPAWIWQHSSSGKVPGVSGLCDMNVFSGNRKEFLASLHGQEVTPKFAPPWSAYTGDTLIGSGRLINPAFVKKISGALGRSGPYAARVVGGGFIATGKLWPPRDFTRRIARELRAGRDVELSSPGLKRVIIKTRKV